jgi:hypothetical protein
MKVLAGLLPIRQTLLFLNERFLVLALVKPNNLLMVRTTFPNFLESRMV